MRTQAWGWLTAGIVAAALNAGYHQGSYQWLHRIAEDATHNSEAVIALASGRADEFLAEARLLTVADTQLPCAELATAEAQVLPSVAAKLEIPSSFAGFNSDKTREDATESRNHMREEVRDQVQNEVRRALNHARAEILRAHMEAHVADNESRFRMDSSSFNSNLIRQISDQFRNMNPPVCTHARIAVPQIPAVRIPNVRVDAAAEFF